jgi:ABC-type multidrug transport system ATPase subunit
VEARVSADPLVLLDGVTRRFGSTTAVDDLTLTAGRGVVGLLGPNGAGKSTLLRMLATVLDPSEGRLRLLGHDPTDRHATSHSSPACIRASRGSSSSTTSPC